MSSRLVVATAPRLGLPRDAVFIGANAAAGGAAPAGRDVRVISPYKDHDEISRASAYCWELALKYCARTGDRLNEIHGVSLSPAYWEALLLPWMIAWLENLYDRYLRLRWVRENLPLAWIEISRVSMPDILYRKSFDVWGQSHLHSVNARLYTLLAEGMGLQEQVLNVGEAPDEPGGRRKDSHRNAFTSLVKRYARFVLQPAAFPRYGDGWVEYGADAIEDDGFPEEPLDRGRLLFGPSADEFESLLKALMPRALPSSLFEEYHGRRDRARRLMARAKVRTLCISNTFWVNDTLKFLLAEVRESGGRVVGRQHGGGYGCYKLVTPERVERRLSDVFITWGWEDDKVCPTLALPDPRLSRLADTHLPGGRDIFYLGSHAPMYMFRYQSYWIPEFVRDRYCPMQEAFFCSLKEPLKSRIVYRPYPKEYGWGERERIERLVPRARFDESPQAVDGMKHCGLVVADHPGTSFLESLVIDAPTIIYWDPAQCPMRPEAEAYFEPLRKTGILHASPEEAAQKVNEVADHPQSWWRSPSVRLAREGFCRRFAWTDPDWEMIWDEKLRSHACLAT